MVSQGVAVGPGVGETKGGQSGLLPHAVQPGCSFSQSPRCRLVHLKALEHLPEPLQELCCGLLPQQLRKQVEGVLAEWQAGVSSGSSSGRRLGHALQPWGVPGHPC